ncbi:GGDEF domain-containing protein [bacterium]|nr:GGDEF domain-containing protein [bacterium]
MKVQSNNVLYLNSPSFTQRQRVNQKASVCQNNSGGVVSILPTGMFYIPVEDVAKDDRTYDSFTGLRDKHFLLAKLDKQIEYSKCFDRDISLAMFDMDNFKSVNELLGYETGDEFIQVIGSNINSVATENGLNAYRFGGDEFVIIFGNQSKEQQEKIVDKVVKTINGNKYIGSKQAEYRNAAETKLAEYQSSTEKINNLVNLEMMKSIYTDMRENFETEEAKNDPYLIKCINDTDEKLQASYSSLINERIEQETDKYSKEWLCQVNENMKKEGALADKDKPVLDEYLKSVYDKTAEMHQIKKWLFDFITNRGFSITGSAVSFDSESLQGKKPIDLIDAAGEVLKVGKHINKGQSYTS